MFNYKTISYSILIGDLIHYGHLKMLETAKKNADYHICGVISDESAKKWMSPVICNYEERKSVIEKIVFVDEVVKQESIDPTENLKQVHERYPDAKIKLVQNHIIGGSSILGLDYIREINGDLISHSFYSRLSQDFIKRSYYNDLLGKRSIKDISLNKIKIGNIDIYKDNFTTKANTIQQLRQILKSSVVEKEFIFTVAQWNDDKNAVIFEITNIFKGKTIVVRSSSMNEDSIDFSNAGHFESVLDVDSSNTLSITNAVNSVIESYVKVSDTNLENQILIQNQTVNVAMSGVLFTRNLWTNTPYYLINFDDKSTKTDTVTSGYANNKIEILNDLQIDEIDVRWQKLIIAIREIELMFPGMALDIEFALKDNGDVVIFQVRPLAANSKFFSLDDEKIKEKIKKLRHDFLEIQNRDDLLTNEVFLSDMSFWNPAELIGDRPGFLDYSLFNHLLMKTNWNEALVPLGYSKVKEPLLEFLGNKPYINIHHAFLSLLPEDLPIELKKKLLEFYNKKLKTIPELHDKIEFEIVHNCLRFDFDLLAVELIENNFNQNEVSVLKKSLFKLTEKLLHDYKKILISDSADIAELEQKYISISNEIKTYNQNPSGIEWNKKLTLVNQLIEDCKKLGTTQFSRVARMAFIGNSLIRSLRDMDIISRKEHDDFMNSIETVATEMDKDFSVLRSNKSYVEVFIKKYGHLRPGTYDITKLPYSKNSMYFNSDQGEVTINSNKNNNSFKEISFALAPRITEQCRINNINVEGEVVLDFIKKTIELREYYKFIYTKNISLAIELIAEVGNDFGFSRERLSNIDYYTVVSTGNSCSKDEAVNTWGYLINGRNEGKNLNLQISLPPVIFSDKDFVIVPSYISKPNYITDFIIEGELLFLDKQGDNPEITGKIVVLEKADPGYDWIFTKKIKGLITKYGGAASHMAIRCAEFGIPAAIGCGDLLFSKISGSSKLILDCKNKIIHYF